MSAEAIAIIGLICGLIQALADLHSRSTVLTEKPSTSAISSMVKPPKYLSSTTWLLRSS